ncbi:cbb3-type cytochrome c oxidase subunit 3 [Microvirga sp. W0021]|uniref:Cbb3-type cytochrome c oxidase subunit 3 n=1 Tax=Hohaiivirga grylli TaxID=3133970 RepID=A0ABV0BLU6_9HYPH
MPETYASVASFSQIGGLVMFLVGFLCVLVYALLPSSKNKFDAAARMPLRED